MERRREYRRDSELVTPNRRRLAERTVLLHRIVARWPSSERAICVDSHLFHHVKILHDTIACIQSTVSYAARMNSTLMDALTTAFVLLAGSSREIRKSSDSRLSFGTSPTTIKRETLSSTTVSERYSLQVAIPPQTLQAVHRTVDITFVCHHWFRFRHDVFFTDSRHPGMLFSANYQIT